MAANRQTVFYFLFALSGFSGLIYESIWTQYLKLFLGHAAYAQTLVIAIFMGGMAIGAWLCSRYSLRWGNLFLGYAIVEGVIGLCALFFHEFFDQTLHLVFSNVLPSLSSPGTITLVKWVLAGLLILPQTILLGMTFPLMSAAILRSYPKTPGRSVGMLYFTNSIGASLGVLTSGFLLIKLIGLPGTIRFAGIINIALAIAVWFLAKGLQQKSAPVPEKLTPQSPYYQRRHFLLFVALMTGTASFIYQIGWIRMLSLVLGSTTHAFELMLSAFILGLALGSLWIKNRIERTASPLKLLAFIQVLMGVFAAATLPLYNQTFPLMHWLVNTLEASNSGYFLYMLSSNSIALLIIFPATFCAGMTLPIITHILFLDNNGEKNIGAVYASNTVGAIVGVFFAVHIGMPQLGLKNLIFLGAGIDASLGLALFWKHYREHKWQQTPVYVMAVLIVLLVFTGSFTEFNSFNMASGVYRTKDLPTQEDSKIIYHKDGKTATISLTSHLMQGKGVLSLRTNGKVDATIDTGKRLNLITDEVTQIQLAAIPMALHPSARIVANIGFGAGVTTNTVLKNPRVSQVDTIEIEPLIIEAARQFGERVELAYNDPRSKIHIEDAKSFFTTINQKYDIIISEPSNPWVSGVANLFTKEFYKSVLPALNNDGVFAQWVQLYEIDMELLSSIFKAISQNFDDYVVYTLAETDILIIAKKSGQMGPLSEEILHIPALSRDLQDIYVNGVQDISFRKIGSKRTLQPYFDSFSIPTNSDYVPVLDQNADRVRFLGASANTISLLNHIGLPLARILEDEATASETTRITLTPNYSPSSLAQEAAMLRDYFHRDKMSQPELRLERSLQYEAQTILSMCRGDDLVEASIRLPIIFKLGFRILPFLSTTESLEIFNYWEDLGARQHLSATEFTWLSLFKSISSRNGSDMRLYAIELLGGQRLPTSVTDFLIAAALTGALRTGDELWAGKFWRDYKRERPAQDPLPFFLLVLAAQVEKGNQA